MILDAIIALFMALFSAAASVSIGLINLVAICIEAVVGIFVSGFSLGRVGRKKGKGSMIVHLVTVALFAMVIGGLIITPMILNRKISLVASDGYSLPFAAVIIHTKKGDKHERTNKAGSINIPRFGKPSVTVKDPRYVERKWQHSEIESNLIVERTVLGSGLDSFADKLLKRSESD